MERGEPPQSAAHGLVSASTVVRDHPPSLIWRPTSTDEPSGSGTSNSTGRTMRPPPTRKAFVWTRASNPTELCALLRLGAADAVELANSGLPGGVLPNRGGAGRPTKATVSPKLGPLLPSTPPLVSNLCEAELTSSEDEEEASLAESVQSELDCAPLQPNLRALGLNGADTLVVSLVCSRLTSFSATLTYLDLSNTRPGFEGVSAVSRILASSEVLQTLLLRDCDLMAHGAALIARGLARNTTVELLE